MILNGNVALVVMDMQNDFITGSLATKNTESKHDSADIIPNINSILKHWKFFTKTFFSQDWHPINHISFHSNRIIYKKYCSDQLPANKIEEANVFDKVEYTIPGVGQIHQVLWPDHCVQNTRGSAIHADLYTNFPHELIYKGCDQFSSGYSIIEGVNKDGEKFVDILKKEGIKVVVLCGIALEYCVGMSAMDISDLGYETYVIYDATARIHKTDHHFQKLLRESNIKIIQTKEFIKVINSNHRYS